MALVIVAVRVTTLRKWPTDRYTVIVSEISLVGTRYDKLRYVSRAQFSNT
jgi:hypothetical protein